MSAASSNEPVVLIQPARGWKSLGLRDLWEYRELMHFLVWRDIKSRYRQMALGPLWILIMPIMNMIVFSVIFGTWAGMPSEGMPHPLFYFAALLPWQLFAVSATKSATSLTADLNLISKVYFPRLVVPISAAATGLLDSAIAFIVLAVMMVGYGIAPQATAAFLPLYLLLALAAALAVGLWLAAIAVRFRDVAYGVTFLMQVWMFATVLYPSSKVPAGLWRTLYRLNPMQTVVEGFRWALFGCGHGPDLIQAVSALLVILFLVSGGYVFRRTERSVVDLL
jgi:lipopolysaccharide transport system permease protein